MRKLEYALKDLQAPGLEGPEDTDLTLIGWGSTKGVIQEALHILEHEGVRANHLHIKYLFPFHEEEVRSILDKSKRTAVVENNFSGQFARHLRAETGFTVDDKILKYDGEPFEPRHIVQRVKEILDGKN